MQLLDGYELLETEGKLNIVFDFQAQKEENQDYYVIEVEEGDEDFEDEYHYVYHAKDQESCQNFIESKREY